MKKIDNLLETRFKGGQQKKGQELGLRSSAGALSGFAGVFDVVPLNEDAREELLQLLQFFSSGETAPSTDLVRLCAITAEIRAIDTQSIFLHGARIQQARQILKEYREGAFTQWLKKTYGNRQTPYNFLQYFEFHQSVSREAKSIVENAPRQSIYMLASRPGSIEKKELFLANHQGKKKKELRKLIQKEFPTPLDDRRKTDVSTQFLKDLEQWQQRMLEESPSMSKAQKQKLHFLCSSLLSHFMGGDCP